MTRVGEFVVRHRRAVLVFWFLVALAGVAMIGSITSRLSSTENLPGLRSYEVSQAIMRTYGTGGDNAPVMMVLRLPPGVRAESTAGRADLASALAPLSRQRDMRGPFVCELG